MGRLTIFDREASGSECAGKVTVMRLFDAGSLQMSKNRFAPDAQF